jgi:hypothetical protein
MKVHVRCRGEWTCGGQSGRVVPLAERERKTMGFFTPISG